MIDISFRTVRFFPAHPVSLDPLDVLRAPVADALGLFPQLAGSLLRDDGRVVLFGTGEDSSSRRRNFRWPTSRGQAGLAGCSTASRRATATADRQRLRSRSRGSREIGRASCRERVSQLV